MEANWGDPEEGEEAEEMVMEFEDEIPMWFQFEDEITKEREE